MAGQIFACHAGVKTANQLGLSATPLTDYDTEKQPGTAATPLIGLAAPPRAAIPLLLAVSIVPASSPADTPGPHVFIAPGMLPSCGLVMLSLECTQEICSAIPSFLSHHPSHHPESSLWAPRRKQACMCSMPSAFSVYGKYIRTNGKWHLTTVDDDPHRAPSYNLLAVGNG